MGDYTSQVSSRLFDQSQYLEAKFEVIPDTMEEPKVHGTREELVTKLREAP
jgi:hypothetical protein